MTFIVLNQELTFLYCILVPIQSLIIVVCLYYFYRILEIIETFQRDVKLLDRNFTVALRNLLLNVRVTTEKEEQNGVYFLPEADNQLPVSLLVKIYIVESSKGNSPYQY